MACLVREMDHDPTMGPALHVGTGRQRLAFRIRSSYRPDRVEIKVWTKIAGDGGPAGLPRDLAFRLVKDVDQGRPRWVAVSRPIVRDDLYFILRAYWNETVGCPHVDRAAWTFHVDP